MTGGKSNNWLHILGFAEMPWIRCWWNRGPVPAGFNAPHQEEFDTEYMRQLYALGYDLAAKGSRGKKTPPGLTVAENR